VGVLGGYTTFSTYMLDARDQLAAGRPEVALTYVGATLVSGLLAVWVGLVLGRSVIAVAGRRSGHELSDQISTAPEAPPTRSDR
jgi:CrcB protein